MEFLGLFLILAGFVIGLGAVTVIDVHGFLGRKSVYWTQATIRTHKVTKPLIWSGTFLYLIGGALYFPQVQEWQLMRLLLVIWVALVINGSFLSFYVSPKLMKMEKQKSEKLLPNNLQRAITISFLISIAGWWSSLALIAAHLVK